MIRDGRRGMGKWPGEEDCERPANRNAGSVQCRSPRDGVRRYAHRNRDSVRVSCSCWSFNRDAMRFAVRWSVNRSLNALFYFHTRATVVGRGFLNVRAHLQLHRLASRRAGAERVRFIRTVSLSAGLPSRSIWPQVFAECRGLLPTAASRIWAACGIRATTRAAPRISTARIWT